MAAAMVRRGCLSLCLSVCLSVSLASHVPDKMTKTLETLQQRYGLSNRERMTGTPIFSRESLSKMEDGAKRVVLGGVLEVYDKLFDQMLRALPTSPSQEAAGLQYIQKEVHRLKTHQYQKHQLIKATLDDLSHIQADNSVVQRRALAELPWLYDTASSLAERKRKSRRRRQVLRKRKI